MKTKADYCHCTTFGKCHFHQKVEETGKIVVQELKEFMVNILAPESYVYDPSLTDTYRIAIIRYVRKNFGKLQ